MYAICFYSVKPLVLETEVNQRSLSRLTRLSRSCLSTIMTRLIVVIMIHSLILLLHLTIICIFVENTGVCFNDTPLYGCKFKFLAQTMAFKMYQGLLPESDLTGTRFCHQRYKQIKCKLNSSSC